MMSEERSSPDRNAVQANPGQEAENDDANLFASVWVKIEVNEDDVIQFQSDDIKEQSLKKQKKKRKPKKRHYQSKLLYCDMCDYTSSHKNSLTIHILGHTDAKPHACSMCDYKTRYPESLKRHILAKHVQFGTNQALPTFKCTICSYSTHLKWNLNSHQRKHELVKQYKCSLCDYSTAYKHNSIKHSRTHDNKPEETTYYCDKCPFTTKHEGHIARHLAKIHFEVSEKASRCDDCSFSTKTGWRLNAHRKRSRQDKPIKCTHCNYQSIYRCAFREHKHTHTEDSQHWLGVLFNPVTNLQIQNVQSVNETSDVNTKIKVEAGTNQIETTKNENVNITATENERNNPSFANITPDSEHEKKNHYIIDPNCEVSCNIQVLEHPNEDRPYQCIICDYRSKVKSAVQRHYQRRHTSDNRPYKCVNCNYSSKTKDQIAKHNKRSSSYKILKCKSCTFTSLFKCQLIMHEKEHYPFRCVHCEYACKKMPEMQKHYLIVHLGHEDMHAGKKPFQCQLCSYRSTRQIQLDNHMNKTHKAEVILSD